MGWAGTVALGSLSPHPWIIRSSLLKKGFVEKECGDHWKLLLSVAGLKASIRTYFSHGARECDDYILGQMAKHLKLSRVQLDDLIDCTMNGEAYVEILRERGGIKT